MEKEPILIKGGQHTDNRGQIHFNNDLDLTEVKRIYTIENLSTETIRAWQGHKIEQRWFAAVSGSFKITLIKVDNWETPSKNLTPFIVELQSAQLNVLHIPAGYISSIQSLQENSILLVMADYLLGAIKDEFRFEIDYFKK
ncbi:MAG: WxcM-like domain-containing protein [Lutibacter sp.]